MKEERIDFFDSKTKENSKPIPKGIRIVAAVIFITLALVVNHRFTRLEQSTAAEKAIFTPQSISLPQELLEQVNLNDSFHVIDQAELIKPKDKIFLLTLLQTLEKETSTQIVIYTLYSLKGSTIERKAVEIFERMRIGQKDLDNGVLLLVALADREMRIEVGYGLEGVLTDLRCSQIIRNLLVPAFKEQQYSKGIVDAVSAMIPIVTEEKFLNPQNGTENNITSFPDSEKEGNLAEQQEETSLSFLKRIKTLIRKVGEFLQNLLETIFLLMVLLTLPFSIILAIFNTATGRGGSFGGGSSDGGFSGGGGSSGGGGASGSW